MNRMNQLLVQLIVPSIAVVVLLSGCKKPQSAEYESGYDAAAQAAQASIVGTWEIDPAATSEDEEHAGEQALLRQLLQPLGGQLQFQEDGRYALAPGSGIEGAQAETGTWKIEKIELRDFYVQLTPEGQEKHRDLRVEPQEEHRLHVTIGERQLVLRHISDP